MPAKTELRSQRQMPVREPRASPCRLGTDCIMPGWGSSALPWCVRPWCQEWMYLWIKGVKVDGTGIIHAAMICPVSAQDGHNRIIRPQRGDVGMEQEQSWAHY